MLPDRVSNPGPLTYESGALPIALRGPAPKRKHQNKNNKSKCGEIKYSKLASTIIYYIPHMLEVLSTIKKK